MPSIVKMLLREESLLIDKQTLIYLRGCNDHAIQMIETYHEICSGLVDIHPYSVSNHLNSIN